MRDEPHVSAATHPRARGFTLIEILISVVIISIGLIGILALLTTALKTSGEVVEDSVAASLARSVYEALRSGAQQRSFAVTDASGNLNRGFEFVHQGVADGTNYTPPLLPTSSTDTAGLSALQQSDFAIFLPPPPLPGASGATIEKIFVFPRPDGAGPGGAQNSSGIAQDNTNNQDNSFNPPHAGYSGNVVVLDVRRVYQMSNRPNATPAGVLPVATDQYGFAISVRRSLGANVSNLATGGALPWATASGTLDPNAYPPSIYSYTDGIYQVEVLVYRNFDPNPMSRTHDPVAGGKFTGLIAIGP
jgi:prepilin-type N-terminal cleavage/methylation domain-containing protein